MLQKSTTKTKNLGNLMSELTSLLRNHRNQACVCFRKEGLETNMGAQQLGIDKQTHLPSGEARQKVEEKKSS